MKTNAVRMLQTLILIVASMVASWPTRSAEPRAPSKPSVISEQLYLDTFFDNLHGAFYHLPFQRRRHANEDGLWINPNPKGQQIRAHRNIFTDQVLMLDAEQLAALTPARRAQIAPLLAAVDKQTLRRTMREAAFVIGERHGRAFEQVFYTEAAGKAQATRGLQGRDGGFATALMPIPTLTPVLLSWDNRQVILTLRVERYRKLRGRGLSVREDGERLDLHYLGAEAPADADPVQYWSENGGQRMLSEIDRGYRAMLELAFGGTFETAKTMREDSAVLEIDGASESFRGREVGRKDDLVYLANGPRSVVLVRTSAP